MVWSVMSSVSLRVRRHNGRRAPLISHASPGSTTFASAAGERAATTRNDGATTGPMPSAIASRCAIRPDTAASLPPKLPCSGSRTSFSTRSGPCRNAASSRTTLGSL